MKHSCSPGEFVSFKENEVLQILFTLCLRSGEKVVFSNLLEQHIFGFLEDY
jgi:hypothetical protein